ncbi:MAG: hypothetical protein QXI11_02060 [Thermoproteota archaeon]
MNSYAEDGGNGSEKYVSKNEFYSHLLKIERRLSRLEIIFTINLIVTIVTLIKLILT